MKSINEQSIVPTSFFFPHFLLTVLRNSEPQPAPSTNLDCRHHPQQNPTKAIMCKRVEWRFADCKHIDRSKFNRCDNALAIEKDCPSTQLQLTVHEVDTPSLCHFCRRRLDEKLRAENKSVDEQMLALDKFWATQGPCAQGSGL